MRQTDATDIRSAVGVDLSFEVFLLFGPDLLLLQSDLFGSLFFHLLLVSLGLVLLFDSSQLLINSFLVDADHR